MIFSVGVLFYFLINFFTPNLIRRVMYFRGCQLSKWTSHEKRKHCLVSNGSLMKLKAYSAELKFESLDFAEGLKLKTVTARKFSMTSKIIRRWTNCKKKIKESAKEDKKVKGRVMISCIITKVEWIHEQEPKKKIFGQIIQKPAIKLCEQFLFLRRLNRLKSF